MLCPNDRTEMRQVKIVGHYGRTIFVDQCKQCGGIWFDEAELFRAKQGEAEEIEMLDTGNLRAPATIENSTLICPRDDAKMHRFTDRYFPQDIVLVRCPSCQGIWLNRGMFTKYQQFRQELMRSKKSTQDEGLKKNIAKLVKSYESGRSTETMRKLGDFLATPMAIDKKNLRYTTVDFSFVPGLVGDIGDIFTIGGIATSILIAILKLLI
jgi:Zn-finger nucleic acid-binding protein